MTNESAGEKKRLTRERIDALTRSVAWQRKACAEARRFAPRIYPCGACGEPVVDGFCCDHCGDTNPQKLSDP